MIRSAILDFQRYPPVAPCLFISKRITPFLFVLFFCLNINLAVATSSSSKEKTLEKAEKFFTKDKYEKALKVYAKLMNDSTIDNHILYKTGLCYYGLSAYSAAIIFLERSIENTENIIPEAEYFLGKSYDGDNKPSKAIPHFYKFEEMLKVLAEVNPENALKFQELAIELKV